MLAELLAASHEAHVNSNGEKCHWTFVKSLVDKAAATTTGLNITRHDMSNACRRQRAQPSNAVTPSPGHSSRRWRQHPQCVCHHM